MQMPMTLSSCARAARFLADMDVSAAEGAEGPPEEEASAHLAAMNQVESIHRPWALTFSFGRALQASALKAWGGKKENWAAGQAALMARAKANSEASLGRGDLGATGESLYVKDYKY